MTKFDLDMENSSTRLASYIFEGKLKSARTELEWIRDHSGPSVRKDEILALIEGNLDAIATKMDAVEIKDRIDELRQEAVKAGPTEIDKALLNY